jgi:predicted nuclease of restriction endonuclease-like (RecB) superfamily
VESLKYHLKSKDYDKYGAMSNNFTFTIPDEKQAARAVRSFKDEYLLDFVNIEEETDPDLIDEPELHAEIVEHIRKFIMAFGEGFCFIGSKFRVMVGSKEGFVDLLFFSRTLHCLVAIELKSGEFKPIYVGQLSFYLSALDEYVKLPEENSSIGIILCKEADKTTVEFAIRDPISTAPCPQKLTTDSSSRLIIVTNPVLSN